MSKLKKYKSMRTFGKTPEPEGSEAPEAGKGPLRFVVQMHAATRTHYDFRIEMDGVYVSWAVPKGPSLDPLERRLAVRTEDHPIEYGSFEGVIPKGNYGAGTVMIWDEGPYVSRETDERVAGEKALLDGYAKGHVTFVVYGSKIKGEFAVIKLAKGEENAWLLVKKSDQYASRSEITNEDRSARTGRTLGEIARDAEAKSIYKPEPAAAAPARKKRKYSKQKAQAALKAAPAEATLPRRMTPPKPTPAPGAFDRAEWIFERFWDGYRALAVAGAGSAVTLTSRLGGALKGKFPAVTAALAALPELAVLDGVIVATDAAGQPRKKGTASPEGGASRHIFFVHDILHWGGKNLRDLPLRQRKEILGALLPEADALQANEFVETDGLSFLSEIGDDAVKGMLARAPDQAYPPLTALKRTDWALIPLDAGPDTRNSSAWKGEFMAEGISMQPEPAAAATPRERKKPRPPALTNLTKIYWPEDGYTKGDMIEYYRQVAPFMVPHLFDRPQSLNRYPHGIHGESFFQKEMAGNVPRWMETTHVSSGHGGRNITYVLCNNAETLLFLANLGCIEINAWNSRADTLECPDYVVIDIDPTDAPFSAVIDVALATRKLLDEIEAPSFVKTSGSRGIHVFVPLEPRYTHDQVRAFAELFARCINLQMPAVTSIERMPEKRIGRVYLDFLQNRRGSTMAQIYSIRPKPKAPVSTPIHWSEVTQRLDPTAFTIKTIFQRLDRLGDLWAPMIGAKTDLQRCFQRLKEHLDRASSRK
jgi:bifunctional non-homologous end joining protein LigD